MEKLTVSKRLAVAKLYLLGLSHQQIAAKTGIAVGSVSSIVTDLKAGVFPEAADLADQIEALRELALDLKHAGVSPGQCSIGLAVLNRIKQCGLDPAAIERLHEILKLAGGEDKAKEFVATVYRIHDFQQETHMSLDEIDAKILELKEKAGELQPALNKVEETKGEIIQLEKKRSNLASVVDLLKENHGLLNTIVINLQTRQGALLKQIKQEEATTAFTQAGLAMLSKENQKLAKAGFSLQELVAFNARIRVIAARHHIAVPGLRGRLLHELEIMGKGLTLETKLKEIRAELKTERKAVTSARQERVQLEASNETLKEQKATLEAEIQANRENISVELGNIIFLAKETLSQFKLELRHGNDEILGTVQHLKDQALEIGSEVGRYKGIVETNQWLADLLTLTKGEDGLEAMRVRVILSMILRGAQAWMKSHPEKVAVAPNLRSTLELLAMELESWRT